MARPSKFNRSEAIEFAMNEIWRQGYEASSVKALSEKLGITRSSFYNAFGSREALFGEVLAAYGGQSPDRALADATPDMSIRNLITDLFRAVCQNLSQDPQSRGCLAINCVAELCGTNQQLGPMLQDLVLDTVARFETLLGWGVANGEFDAEMDTHAMALSLQNLLVGLNLMSKVVRSQADLWRVAQTTLRGLDILAEK